MNKFMNHTCNFPITRLSILLFVMLCCNCTQHRKANPPLDTKSIDKNKNYTDTTFLKRTKGEGFYCKVYIERNRTSERYRRLLDFTIDSAKQVYYEKRYKLNYVKTSLTKYKLGDLPREWLQLYYYKGKYYLYSNNDLNLSKKLLTDSTICDWNKFGIEPQKLLNINRVNHNTFALAIRKPYKINKNSYQLIIHTVDPLHHAAVWEVKDKVENYQYKHLYVPKAYANYFDLIVSECSDGETPPFQFDEINYQALLQSGLTDKVKLQHNQVVPN